MNYKLTDNNITKVEISKQDIAGKELPGARLTILDKDGKEVESWTSTEEPHYIEGLPVGEYTLREETAPDGYLTAEDVKFTIKDTGEVQKTVMKDEAKPEEKKPEEIKPEEKKPDQTESSPAAESPQTGDDTPILFWFLLAGLSAFGAMASTLLFRKKRQR